MRISEAKKNKNKLIRSLTIVGILTSVQVGILSYFHYSNPPKNEKEMIDSSIEKLSGITDQRKSLLKAQLAITTYMSKNNGKPPSSLTELIPDYIDKVPVDNNAKPVSYVVVGNKYALGDDAQRKFASSNLDKKNLNLSPNDSGLSISIEDKDQLLAAIKDDESDPAVPFDPKGKRDPFKPFNIAPRDVLSESKTPLENYSLDKLFYSAYLATEDEPKAIIENTEGHGFTITKGTKIGPNNGIVTDIFPQKVVVVETTTDFKGKSSSRTYEFIIGAKGRQNGK